MGNGLRQLPLAHLTARLPWHDNGWSGTICKSVCNNSSCIVLDRIGTKRNDAREMALAGQSLRALPRADLPPCVEERATVMADFSVIVDKPHPYARALPQTHGHFVDTPFQIDPYTVTAVPFRWMLKAQVEGADDHRGTQPGLVERLKLDQYSFEREAELVERMGLKTNTWLQYAPNQRLLLDTWRSALRPRQSLIFFYCKSTPLSDSGRRVIVGVARVTSVQEQLQEYDCVGGRRPKGAIEGILWERNIGHSLRPDDVSGGFLMPYLDVLRATEGDASVDPERHVAFAPDALFDSYSYASEHLSQDGAIASLVTMAKALEVSRGVVSAPVDAYLDWIDVELNRLWRLRGAYPGMGSALCALGIPHGNLLAWHLMAQDGAEEKMRDPWPLLSSALSDPGRLPEYLRDELGPTIEEKWRCLDPDRRELLQLLARFDLTESQATRWYKPAERRKAKIESTDADILQNPYVVFEADRLQSDAVSFEMVDRGLFADATVRHAFPLPQRSRVSESIDPRRVHAAIIACLEDAASSGHTMLPVDMLISKIAEQPLKPEFRLDEDDLAMVRGRLSPEVEVLQMPKTGTAYQLNRYMHTSQVITEAVLRAKRAKPLAKIHDWRKRVNDSLRRPDGTELIITERDRLAREEKAAALEVIYRSPLSVLIGGAGTGKSTLIRALCEIEDVRSENVLMLAPTGKARVRLERASGRTGGKTVAQFLHRLDRYDPSTHRYYTNAKAPTLTGYGTVVVDESSMLTEEQLAAILEACVNVKRIILLGDPHQLPPIGAGHPFVSVERMLRPPIADSLFPRVGPCYAALTVSMRQDPGNDDSDGAEPIDLRLANMFSGRPELRDHAVWHAVNDHVSRLNGANAASRIRLVRFTRAEQVPALVNEEIRLALNLAAGDEASFEASLGGHPSEYQGRTTVWFNVKYKDRPGSAEKAESWQILTPVRRWGVGSVAINRAVQKEWRRTYREQAMTSGHRVIPRPMGPEEILYGDKVINLENRSGWRAKVYPEKDDAFVANGDVGMVVGQRRTKVRSIFPKDVEVEMSSQPGFAYKYGQWEFGRQDGSVPLELAYALTVHKSQGSEFGLVILVVPNPCANLSREMLYTALTRHVERVIILYQGDFQDLQQYAHDSYSEIAGRMVSLFEPSQPIEVRTPTGKTRVLDANLVYRTERGDDLVKSKSELIIADKLHAAGIRYTYEQPLSIGGLEYQPDFTYTDPSGRVWYWEHCGLMSNDSYRRRWERKLQAYRSVGIVPYEEGSAGTATLLITEERKGVGLDVDRVRTLIGVLTAL
ncbi:MAG: helicase [Ramlibacter sp.]|jgi:hypothetical protein|nr:helicase [Ramlibacter sp.]